MNIAKNQKDIESCRFCYMCRHVCSTARAEQSEALTPRSKGLIMSYVLKGILPYGREIDDAIYKCCMCGYCSNWCEGNWDPPAYIQSARFDLVEQGMEAPFITAIKDNILNKGSLAGEKKPSGLAGILPDRAKLVLVRGIDSSDTSINALKQVAMIYKKAGIDIAFSENMPSGFAQLYLLGYKEDAVRLAKELVEAIRALNAEKAVFMSATDLHILKKISEEEDLTPGFETEHITLSLKGLIESGKLIPAEKDNVVATFHDNDYMCRYLGLIKEPRSILATFPWIELKEMIWCEDKGRTTGSLLFSYMYPELSGKISKSRFEEVLETGATMVIAGDTEDRVLLEALVQEEHAVQVVDIIELVYKNIQ